MKNFLKVALAVVLAGCTVCGCGRMVYKAKVNQPCYHITVLPDYPCK